MPLPKGRLDLRDHLEQTEDWQDVLVVDIAPGQGGAIPQAWAVWNSSVPGAIRSWEPTLTDPLPDVDPDTVGRWVGEIALPNGAHRLLGPEATLRLTVTPR